MIDHLSFGVRNFAQSANFYDRIFAPPGISRLYHVTTGPIEKAAYGKAYPNLWIASDPSASGKLHIAFAAPDKEAVDAFHREALASGGTGNVGEHIAKEMISVRIGRDVRFAVVAAVSYFAAPYGGAAKSSSR